MRANSNVNPTVIGRCPRYEVPPPNTLLTRTTAERQAGAPDTAVRRPRWRCFPLFVGFPDSRRRCRAADGTAQTSSSWGYPVSSNSPRCGGARLGGRRGFGLRRFRLQVSEENLLNHYRILDAGDDSHRPAAGSAHVDVKDPLRTSALRRKPADGISPCCGQWSPWQILMSGVRHH